VAELKVDGHHVFDAHGRETDRAIHREQALRRRRSNWGRTATTCRGDFEQPGAVAKHPEMVTAHNRSRRSCLGGGRNHDESASTRSRCSPVAPATMRAWLARYWIEAIAALPCSVEIASEYRYRESVPNPDALIVTVSQSGRQPTPLPRYSYAKSLGQNLSLAICNVAESTLIRLASLIISSPAPAQRSGWLRPRHSLPSWRRCPVDAGAC